MDLEIDMAGPVGLICFQINIDQPLRVIMEHAFEHHLAQLVDGSCKEIFENNTLHVVAVLCPTSLHDWCQTTENNEAVVRKATRKCNKPRSMRFHLRIKRAF